MGQAVIYLALAPKALRATTPTTRPGFRAAGPEPRGAGDLRNAPTRLMKELGYGHAYRYAHDEPHGYAAGETYFPEGMQNPHWYQPVSRGLEIKIAEKMAFLRRLDEEAGGGGDSR